VLWECSRGRHLGITRLMRQWAWRRARAMHAPDTLAQQFGHDFRYPICANLGRAAALEPYVHQRTDEMAEERWADRCKTSNRTVLSGK
jgi:hypothetical protein